MTKSSIIKTSIAVIAGIAAVAWLHINVFGAATTSDDDTILNRLENRMESNSNNTDTSRTIIIQTMKYLNGLCPKMLDEGTRLDSVNYKAGNLFIEYYTMINVDKASLDTTEVKPRISESIINNIKSNAALAAFRNYNVNFIYIYRDKNGIQAFLISVTHEQYSN